MKNDLIQREARRIVRICESRNPFKIARELGVHVEYRDDFESLKGMYAVVMRNRFIGINNKLDEHTKKVVCAHELGHDRFHKHLAMNGALHEFMLYDMRYKPEYEANIFAAEILIDDGEIFTLLNDAYDVSMIARTLELDINLVSIKIESLRLQGYEIRSPFRAKSNFLR